MSEEETIKKYPRPWKVCRELKPATETCHHEHYEYYLLAANGLRIWRSEAAFTFIANCVNRIAL